MSGRVITFSEMPLTFARKPKMPFDANVYNAAYKRDNDGGNIFCIFPKKDGIMTMCFIANMYWEGVNKWQP